MPTVLLVHCDGTNGSTTFTDTYSRHTLQSNTSAAVSTAQVKFGTGSALIPSTGSVQVLGNLGDFNFQSTPFTIELWAYATTTPAVASLFSQFNNSPGNGFFFGSVSGNLGFWYYDGAGTQVQFNSTTAIATGGWHFYTADRDAGGTLRLYIDGVVVATRSAPTFQNVAPATYIGNTIRVTDYWPGYIDEVRVTNGAALYAGAFTPPTGPFPDPATDARATQVASEQWIMPNANAQATQVLLEMWAPGGTTTPIAVATQVALEQWAVTGLAITTPQPRAWIMA